MPLLAGNRSKCRDVTIGHCSVPLCTSALVHLVYYWFYCFRLFRLVRPFGPSSVPRARPGVVAEVGATGPGASRPRKNEARARGGSGWQRSQPGASRPANQPAGHLRGVGQRTTARSQATSTSAARWAARGRPADQLTWPRGGQVTRSRGHGGAGAAESRGRCRRPGIGQGSGRAEAGHVAEASSRGHGDGQWQWQWQWQCAHTHAHTRTRTRTRTRARAHAHAHTRTRRTYYVSTFAHARTRAYLLRGSRRPYPRPPIRERGEPISRFRFLSAGWGLDAWL